MAAFDILFFLNDYESCSYAFSHVFLLLLECDREILPLDLEIFRMDIKINLYFTLFFPSILLLDPYVRPNKND